MRVCYWKVFKKLMLKMVDQHTGNLNVLVGALSKRESVPDICPVPAIVIKSGKVPSLTKISTLEAYTK